MAVRMPAGKEDQSCHPGAAAVAVMMVLLGLLKTKLTRLLEHDDARLG
jgi:hypothetical protein